MIISVGDRLPQASFMTLTGDGHQAIATDVVFTGRKVVLFGIPGVFTPTCSRNHFPGFLQQVDAIKARGVDTIACLTVNDIHVVEAWVKQSGAAGKILMLADGEARFAKALGLNRHMNGMGERVRRFSMVVDDGEVRLLNVEDKPGVNVSGADTILRQLDPGV